MTDPPRTWHHGLVARWWAEFNHARPEEIAYYADAIRSRWLPNRRDDLPERWPGGATRHRCADGSDLELANRLEALDPAAQRITLGIRARRWRGDELIEQEERSMPIALYFGLELAAMLERTGFREVDVQGWYTGNPADPDDASVVFVARK